MKYNYIFESKSENRKSNFKTIVITSIITAFLTGISQFFLQKKQLSDEQDYWKKRYNIETVKAFNENRFRIIEELSSEILQLEVQAKEIKIQSAVLKYSKDIKSLDEMKELVKKYHKDLYRTAAKMEIASIYFDKEVDDKLIKLSDALTENYNNNYVDFHSSNIDIPEFNLDFETIKKVPKTKKEVFEAMIKNMNNDLENATK